MTRLNFFGAFLFFLAAVSTGAVAEEQGAQILGYLHGDQRQYWFCPTDTHHSQASALSILALVACTPQPGMAVCAAGGLGIILAGNLIGQTSVNADAARYCHLSIPENLEPYQVPHWLRICEIVVSALHNGQPIDRNQALILARERLRSEGYTSCFSDENLQKILGEHSDLPLSELVNLVFGQITQYGSRFFGRPQNSLIHHTREAMTEQARQYLVMRRYSKSINEFDGVSEEKWNYLLTGVGLGVQYRIKDLDASALRILQTDGIGFPSK